MVGDPHEVADRQGWRNTTGCVGKQNLLNTKRGHDPNRKRYLIHRVTLVVVQPAGLQKNIRPAESTDDKLPSVAIHSRYSATRYFSKGNCRGILNLLDHLPKGTTQHDSQAGPQLG